MSSDEIIEEIILEANGSIGLIKAIERFDPTKTDRFEGYAFIRIRGAMIDELRSMDWVPRTVKDMALIGLRF